MIEKAVTQESDATASSRVLLQCHTCGKRLRERDENKVCDGHFERSTRVTGREIHMCENKTTRDHRSNVAPHKSSNITTKLVKVLYKVQLN